MNPVHDIGTVTPFSNGETGGFLRLKPDYIDKPIREAVEAVLLDDARTRLKDLGAAKVTLLRGLDALKRPIVGWVAGGGPYPENVVISTHEIGGP